MSVLFLCFETYARHFIHIQVTCICESFLSYSQLLQDFWKHHGGYTLLDVRWHSCILYKQLTIRSFWLLGDETRASGGVDKTMFKAEGARRGQVAIEIFIDEHTKVTTTDR
jgi:hypothetical protein